MSKLIKSNPKLWEEVKKIADRIYKKPSAYKSGYIVRLYKEMGGDFLNKKPKKPTGIKRWFLEDWRNQRGETGYKFKSDIYRPTKIITEATPLTFKELGKEKIKKARRKKRMKGRVNKF